MLKIICLLGFISIASCFFVCSMEQDAARDSTMNREDLIELCKKTHTLSTQYPPFNGNLKKTINTWNSFDDITHKSIKKIYINNTSVNQEMLDLLGNIIKKLPNLCSIELNQVKTISMQDEKSLKNFLNNTYKEKNWDFTESQTVFSDDINNTIHTAIISKKEPKKKSEPHKDDAWIITCNLH